MPSLIIAIPKITGNIRRLVYRTDCCNLFQMLSHKSDIDGNAEWMTMINYSPVPQKVNAKVKENIRYEVVKGSLEQIDPFELTIVKIG